MLSISGLQNGIVLDHIRAGRALSIYNALGLDKLNTQVAVIMNVRSNKMGRKDIIKVEGDLKDLDLDVLGFFDHHITVNIIQNNEIVDKKKLSLPTRITGIIRCKNPRCITSIEQELEQKFVLTDRANKVYRCIYCEEIAAQSPIKQTGAVTAK